MNRSAILALSACLLLSAGCGSGEQAAATSNISVSVSPNPVTLAGGTSQIFTPTVTNDSTNAGVTWSIGSGVGTLSAVSTTSVTYTVPTSLSSAATVTLTTTSKADPTRSATATITALPPISVSVGPTPVTLSGGAVQIFTPTVTNDPSNAGVTWSIGSGVGTLSGVSTTSATYTAPTSLSSAATVTLTATSKADPTRSGTATITALPPISVSVSPTPITMAGGAVQIFTPTVSNDPTNAGVVWSIGTGVGAITASSPTSATYTAPTGLSSATTVTLTAISRADASKSGTATITVSASPAITVSVSPTPVSVASGAAQVFTPTVSNDPSNAGVTWSIGSGVGALSAASTTSVTYTAPTGLATAATVTLTATSKADPTKSGTATITALPPISVSISPTSVTLAGGTTQVFTPTVSNDPSNAGVTWSIGSGVGTLSAVSTTSVTYTAPTGLSSAATVTLTATSKADPTKSSTATITALAAITVSISPPTPVTLAGGASQVFTPTVANDPSNAGVTWSIGTGVGALTAVTTTSATYTAPTGLSSAATVTLTATSKADTTKSGTVTITALAAITLSISPTPVTLAGGASQVFTPTVSNDPSNAGVTWSIGSGVGTLSAVSTTSVTYTAPTGLSSPATVTLTATSKADTTKTSTVTITDLAAITVSVSPTPITLAGGAAQVFTPTVSNDPSNAGVTWSIGSGVGSITGSSISSVTYNAPTGLSSATSVTLTATSIADPTKSGTAAITVSPSAPSGITVSLLPTTVTLAASATQVFTPTVSNDSTNAGVTWSIGSGPGAITASSITSATYTAPAGLPAAATVTITATSIADTSKSASATITLSAPTAPASQWVYYDATGNLAYKTMTNADNTGADGYDQIMDFSTAGYMQGAVPIPTATVQATISPSGDTTGAQDTTNIQNAINTVGAMTLNTTTGLRGAVLLNPGNYYVNTSLTITKSGVVLRGSGSGTSSTTNTIINAVAATTPYPLVILGTSGLSPSNTGSSTAITDAYVPAGAKTLDVASTSGLGVGTTILITRPVTQTWIDFMGMNSATAPIDNCSGGGCNWITAGTSVKTDRTITAISGNRITLDAPVTDSIDSNYIYSTTVGVSSATLRPYTFTSRISQVGVENLREIAPVPPTNLVPPTPSYQLVVTFSVINAWIQNLTAQDSLQAIDIENNSKQVTVYNVAITHTNTQTNSAKFEEFYISAATQVLMDTVSDTMNNMYFFATSTTTQGPNVLRNSTFKGNYGIEPHQRWATGLLVENTTLTAISGSIANGINFYNRGDFGSGHGWTIGWGVAWNTTTGTTGALGPDIFQQPPGSQNWCIGCIGRQITQAAPGGSVVLPQGAIDSSGTYVFPASLYQAQLTQRLGHP